MFRDWQLQKDLDLAIDLAAKVGGAVLFLGTVAAAVNAYKRRERAVADQLNELRERHYRLRDRVQDLERKATPPDETCDAPSSPGPEVVPQQ